MTSFKAAIKAGIESAELARTKKNEIQSLFDTLATDVEEAFDHNVRLFLKRQFKPAEEHPFAVGRAIQEAIVTNGVKLIH
ncbi:hypothetical protein C5610_05700 [Idiomarina sp. OT37-5b]|uniref:hypothetical protein n=1 Tax=Idiomarina sp. OT37-5b TaxID=2100422 RepID=UPI000CF9D221|nr:hypothetical protein [Idiomarina sp. OT37-5b]AVJ55852.1 hypothetical protein C5610_05700 [Idiomarina sp. OT37-5b]